MRRLSLRTKIFFLFLGAALLIVVPALVLIAQTVEDRVYERATEELRRTGEALSIHWGLEDEVLAGDARVRALGAGVAELLVEGDTARLQRQLTRDLAEGRIVIAADSAMSPLTGIPLDSAVLWRSVGRGSVVTESEAIDEPLRVAVWPVWTADRVAGFVGVGARLDAAAATRMLEVTGSPVALLADGEMVATTFPEPIASALRELPLSAVIERGGIWSRELEGHPFLYSVHRLPSRGDVTMTALLFRPVANELQVVDGILRSLLAIGFAAILLALLLAGLVSRIVARPAQALASAAADLARGEFDTPIPRASDDEIGQLAGAFGKMRSAIAERETRLRAAQAELVHREKLAAMGRLVAQLSHEINNPIYNIQNCLEALDRRGVPGDPNREFLTLAQEELSRMATLTRQLLDQSRPLSDDARSLDLNEVVRRVLTLARPKLETHDVALDLDLDEVLPPVTAHADAMHEVMANLVDNAVDAMPGGGTLRVRTRGTEEIVAVEISDTGTGISDEELPRIFEAFYTTKPGVRGVGLGLFVAEGIVRGHRGELEVKSTPGQGTTFMIRLPREALDDLLSPSVIDADLEPATDTP